MINGTIYCNSLYDNMFVYKSKEIMNNYFSSFFTRNHKDEIFKKEKNYKGKWFSHVSL